MPFVELSTKTNFCGLDADPTKRVLTRRMNDEIKTLKNFSEV